MIDGASFQDTHGREVMKVSPTKSGSGLAKTQGFSFLIPILGFWVKWAIGFLGFTGFWYGPLSM